MITDWLPTPTAVPVRHIELSPFDNVAGSQRKNSDDDRIEADKTYLACILGRWYLGQFSKQWFGWLFDDWGRTGMQLASIEDLYEIDLSSLS